MIAPKGILLMKKKCPECGGKGRVATPISRTAPEGGSMECPECSSTNEAKEEEDEVAQG